MYAQGFDTLLSSSLLVPYDSMNLLESCIRGLFHVYLSNGTQTHLLSVYKRIAIYSVVLFHGDTPSGVHGMTNRFGFGRLVDDGLILLETHRLVLVGSSAICCTFLDSIRSFGGIYQRSRAFREQVLGVLSCYQFPCEVTLR